jgi:AraC-like DNA-binding protein
VCRQAVETATGTPATDEGASHQVRHPAAGCEACGADESASTRGLPWPRLQNVCEFIQHNLNQQLTLLNLAAVVHMSRYHFARLFKQSAGVPPHRFVLGRRIARASALVRGITPSAYRCGWRHGR